MSVKYKELEISDRIMSVVDRGVTEVEKKLVIEDADLVRLEKLTKVYTMLMSSTRENIKHKIYSNIDLNDLEELTDDLNGPDDGDDPGADFGE